MIKFKYIIHKQTGIVIKYDDWLEKSDNNKYIEISSAKYGTEIYNKKYMLFDDDFEIIYDTEFTKQELTHLYLESGVLKEKLYSLINERERIQCRYGIDL